MTAATLFFKAANSEHLPAAVPIYERESGGVATVVFFVDQEHGGDLAFSADDHERAVAAIFACHAAREAVLAMIPAA